MDAALPVGVYSSCARGNPMARKGAKHMKQEEKKPILWEVADPKPPIVQSGHMENRKENQK